MLRKAYEKRKDKNIRKTIDEQFCRKHEEDMEGVRSSIDLDSVKFDALDGQIKTNYKRANDLIRKIMNIMSEYRYQTIDTLLSIYKKEDIEDTISLNSLISQGLVQRKHEKYSLSYEIEKLFDYIHRNVHGDFDLIKYYFIQRWV